MLWKYYESAFQVLSVNEEAGAIFWNEHWSRVCVSNPLNKVKNKISWRHGSDSIGRGEIRGGGIKEVSDDVINYLRLPFGCLATRWIVMFWAVTSILLWEIIESEWCTKWEVERSTSLWYVRLGGLRILLDEITYSLDGLSDCCCWTCDKKYCILRW